MQKKKRLQRAFRFVNSYFWRTHAQQAIDLIEESEGILYAKEFKWNERAKSKLPESFSNAYGDSLFEVINRTNYMDFLL